MKKLVFEMQMISICQEMGWDYYQYMKQPKWFIDFLMDKLKIDSEEIKKIQKKK